MVSFCSYRRLGNQEIDQTRLPLTVTSPPVQYLNSLLCISSCVVLPIQTATDAAVRHDFSFHTKGIDEHPGTVLHSYRDVLSSEAIEEFEAVLQLWLPETLLIKLSDNKIMN